MAINFGKTDVGKLTMKSSQVKKFLLRQIRYPEFLVIFFLALYLGIFVPSPSYQIAFFGLMTASVIALLIATQKSRNLVFDAASLFLLAINLGLLQLTYIPSICLWLILAYRLLLIKHKNLTAVLAVASGSIVVLVVLALLGLDLKLHLTDSQHLQLNNLSLALTALVFFHQMWYLSTKVQYLSEKHHQDQDRLQGMVSRINKLSRFLPPQVWQPIIQQNKNIAVISQRRKLTIFFSDIVGFTDLSDNISPDHLANILNTYFDAMTKITQKYGATLDKFIGDGLLCFFGDKPDSNEHEDALRCAIMAIEMRREMQVLRQQWRLLGFEGLYVRIGINTGYCYVGNFGSHNRMTYTLIGKEANFASRLESAAKPNQILISESTYNLISHKLNCQIVGKVHLKGLQDPVMVWEVLTPEKDDIRNQNNWIDHQLSGFNLHLNFKEIRNYDKRTIMNHLNHALDLLDKKLD
ncbi:adenylate/guanylate cyclase [Moraxella macacae 0408225]|uniref:Adenylate/guanylate cyclase n=1 Tax=Moraxella macacae 0408225 TaxID=1230338 RepID=L2F679_9GAMM|nr:adenylate/guanylate cyclase domain-containing protein [Moraxella macacae]ELA08549.1 adenylate/guanylate cyclase [Moraxella macacae 0408225]